MGSKGGSVFRYLKTDGHNRLILDFSLNTASGIIAGLVTSQLSLRTRSVDRFLEGSSAIVLTALIAGSLILFETIRVAYFRKQLGNSLTDIQEWFVKVSTLLLSTLLSNGQFVSDGSGDVPKNSDRANRNLIGGRIGGALVGAAIGTTSGVSFALIGGVLGANLGHFFQKRILNAQPREPISEKEVRQEIKRIIEVEANFNENSGEQDFRKNIEDIYEELEQVTGELQDIREEITAESSAHDSELDKLENRIRGLGPVETEAMRKAGYETIDDIRSATSQELMEISDLDADSVIRVKAEVRDENDYIDNEESSNNEQYDNGHDKTASPSSNTSTQLIGRVEFINRDSGYGFIETEDKDEDFLFHLTDISSQGIEEGDKVTFELSSESGDPSVRNVEKL